MLSKFNRNNMQVCPWESVYKRFLLFLYWILRVLQYEKVAEILYDRHVMPEWSGWNKAMKAMNGTLDFVKTAIDKHKSNYNEDVKENPKDFIDAFLNQINDKDNIG